MDAILVLLEDTYLHGYEIIKDIQDEFGEICLSTFYRWLRELESLGLIDGITVPGQRGPDRKPYALTKKGREYVLELAKNSLKLLVKLYERYRLYSATQFESLLTKFSFPKISGKVLFAGMSRIHSLDIGTLRFISRRVEGKPIDVIGDTARLSGIEVTYRPLGGNLTEMPARDNTYCEIWVSGTPKKHEIADIIRVCARVLKPEGILRLIVPHMFSKSVEDEGIGGFIQYASMNLFSEIELVFKEELIDLLKMYFSDISVIETGILVFWGKKRGMNRRRKSKSRKTRA